MLQYCLQVFTGGETPTPAEPPHEKPCFCICERKAQILKRLDLPFLCIFDPGHLFKIFSTLAPF